MPHDQPVIEVITDDGHRFELIHVPAAEPRGTLLFMPGMGLSARQYISFAQELAEIGVEVYIHEWRGMGSSNRRASRAVNWGYRELLQHDLDAALATVTRIAGDDRILVGGHSLGSQFACMLAALRPHTCQGLILVAGGTPCWKTFDWKMRIVMLCIIGFFPLISAILGYYPGKRLGFAGTEARGVISDWIRTARSGRYEPPGIDTDLETGMSKLQVRALALHMADDWFVPKASLELLTGKLDTAQISACTINTEDGVSKVDHFRWMSRPDLVVSQIRQWMNREP